MEKPEGRPPKTGLEGKLRWEHPRVTLVGALSLLVRAGSAQGKTGDENDGDMNNFQVRPKS